MADDDSTVFESIKAGPDEKRPCRDPLFDMKDRVDQDLHRVMTALLVCEYAVGAMDAIKSIDMKSERDPKFKEAVSGVCHFPDDGEVLGHIGDLISQSINTLHSLKVYANGAV